MEGRPLVWLTEQDVVSLVSLNEAIEALEMGLTWDGAGAARNLQKALGTWGDGSSMHALGSLFSEAGYCGFKTWVNTKRGANAVFVLFDANDGALIAVIEAAALGQLRTAGISGLATRWLARDDADDMAVIGTGRQALMQVAGVAAVRPLRRLRIFSPTAERRRQFAAEASGKFDFEVVEAGSVREATADAGIVTLVTRAEEPFFQADMLAKGAHLNAVGAILRPRAEFHQDVFERASLLACDYLPNLQLSSREFIERCEQGAGRWDEVVSLSQLIAEKRRRPAGADVTLFKAMGMGISDLSVALEVYRRACTRGVGREIDAPRHAMPTWLANAA